MNENFIQQVYAAEQRRKKLGAHVVPPIWYINPAPQGLSPADTSRAAQLGLPLARILADVHVGAEGGAGRALAHVRKPGVEEGVVVLETNAGTHDVARGLAEATDLIQWLRAPANAASRILARAASFCAGSVTQNDASNFDQAMAWWLPNSTVILQPPGHVHAGFSQTWASTTVNSAITVCDSHGNSSAPKLSFVAQRQGSSLVVRVVNPLNVSRPLTVALLPSDAPMLRVGDALRTWMLAPDCSSQQCLEIGNTPMRPDAVRPVVGVGKVETPNKMSVKLPPFSVVIINVSLGL